jgi:hypothetical protein
VASVCGQQEATGGEFKCGQALGYAWMHSCVSITSSLHLDVTSFIGGQLDARQLSSQEGLPFLSSLLLPSQSLIVRIDTAGPVSAKPYVALYISDIGTTAHGLVAWKGGFLTLDSGAGALVWVDAETVKQAEKRADESKTVLKQGDVVKAKVKVLWTVSERRSETPLGKRGSGEGRERALDPLIQK